MLALLVPFALGATAAASSPLWHLTVALSHCNCTSNDCSTEQRLACAFEKVNGPLRSTAALSTLVLQFSSYVMDELRHSRANHHPAQRDQGRCAFTCDIP